MKNRKLFWLAAMFFLLGNTVYAQRYDDKRMKLELTIITAKGKVVANVTSASISASRYEYDDADTTQPKKPTRNFALGLTFDNPSIEMLRAVLSNKNGVDGFVTMSDSYNKVPTRKIEFKSALLDGLSDQLTTDYSSSFFTLKTMELTIDGLKIEL